MSRKDLKRYLESAAAKAVATSGFHCAACDERAVMVVRKPRVEALACPKCAADFLALGWTRKPEGRKGVSGLVDSFLPGAPRGHIPPKPRGSRRV